MEYGIGLDIGIGSVGWAVLALDHEENPWGIIDLGSRIFDAAEQPKTGASLALPRREARSMRRRLRRRRHRLERIRNLFIKCGLLTTEQLDHLYDGKLEDIYTLRVRALDERLTDEELARVLLHLAHRRGFKSNRKAESQSAEAGELKKAISLNQKTMEENHYRTVGEMFCKDPRYTEYKRNRGGNYLNTVDRAMVEDEARKILEIQEKLGNSKLNGDFQESYLSILLSQRQFDEGPGGKSHYGGNQILNKVGTCTFEDGSNGEPAEKRSPKVCYSFEYFNLLQKVNHLRLTSSKDNRGLDEAERKKVIALAKNKADLHLGKIRKDLQIPSEYRFQGVSYNTKELPEETEKKTKFNYLPFYHQMQKLLKSKAQVDISDYSLDVLDKIGQILAFYKGDDARRKELEKLQLAPKAVEALLEMNGTTKFSHLSLKAIRKITPFLEQGMTYEKACEAAGYDFRAHQENKSFLLPADAPELEDITNPVVRRAIGQTIKVVNAIIRKQGSSPLYVNVELAREMAKDFQERIKIKNENEANQSQNDTLMKEIRETYQRMNPSGMDLVKWKLWKEQDGKSPYSQNSIVSERLFETGYVEVDHIIPYSISFDDSYKNKVLVFSWENRDKGNRLPYQYLLQKYGQGAADRFKVWVNNNVRDYRKRQRLLKEEMTEEEISGFKERNLSDTKYISRFMYNFIRDHLEFAPSETGKKKRVLAVNGRITSYLRKLWGIRKIRANGDKHHAVDAVIIACTTDKEIQDLTVFSEEREKKYEADENGGHLVNTSTGEVLKRFPFPWDGFQQELEARCSVHPERELAGLPFYMNKDLNDIKPIFVSRMPRRKVTGAAHEATVRCARQIEDEIALSKTALTDLKLDEDGEIKNYYNPDSDRLLYEALKEKLIQCKGQAKVAFKDPFYKPKADGTPGPLVKKVKLKVKATLAVPVEGKTGVADNDSMVRVDVFKIEGEGYYLVPVYVADTVKKELPKKAIIAHKPYKKWKDMDEKDFLFTLYPNDLIYVESKKEMIFKIPPKKRKNSTLEPEFSCHKIFGYYQGTDRYGGVIDILTDDGAYLDHGQGVKRLLKIKKYQVDVLGNIHLVEKEIRRKFIIKQKAR